MSQEVRPSLGVVLAIVVAIATAGEIRHLRAPVPAPMQGSLPRIDALADPPSPTVLLASPAASLDVAGENAAPTKGPTALAPRDEQSIMRELRALRQTDPERSLALAREGNALYPDGDEAAEREWMVVKSLVGLRRFGEAKAEAAVMVHTYPGTTWVADAERHLLTNPL